jgi:hypothetical protein
MLVVQPEAETRFAFEDRVSATIDGILGKSGA